MIFFEKHAITTHTLTKKYLTASCTCDQEICRFTTLNYDPRCLHGVKTHLLTINIECKSSLQMIYVRYYTFEHTLDNYFKMIRCEQTLETPQPITAHLLVYTTGFKDSYRWM